VIEILRSDLIRTFKLLGCASVADLDRSFIDVPADWFARSQKFKQKAATPAKHGG
jgi:hypothetical protein